MLLVARAGVRFCTALAVVLSLAPQAWATIDNLKSYKQAYPGKEPKAYSCKVCHQGPVGKATDLNAYGQALQKLQAPVTPKKLTVEDYQAFDAQDADGDGATNRQELDAGTDLMDPAVTPSADPAAAPAAEPSAAPSSRRLGPAGHLQAYLESLVTPDAWADAASEPAAAAPKAEYVGSETCAACHAKEHEEFKRSTHARIEVPGDLRHAQGCEMCHGPGSLHVEAGGGRGVGGIINPRKDPSTCFACHMDKRASFRLPHHHPVLEGKMSCADCHSPHGEDVRPWSATTLKDVNEACFKCHKEQRGPFVWEHEALREGCTTCHQPHGSINEKMLVVRDHNLCLRCHSQVNFPTIGNQSHSSFLTRGTCFSAGCHTAVHGSNFSDHLRY